MTLAARIHDHISENLSHVPYPVDVLAYAMGASEADITRALQQLKREGRAREDDGYWQVSGVEEKAEKQGALFA